MAISLASAEGAKHGLRCSPDVSMTTNGKRRPRRPAIQVIAPAASPEQAAAIAAALERFLHDTAPVIAPRRPVAEPVGARRARRGRLPPGPEPLGRPAALGRLPRAGRSG